MDTTSNNIAALADFIENGNWFDPVFYAQHYKDVASYPLGLIHHYINYGMDEGRIPKEKSLIPALRKSFTEFIEAGVVFDFRKDTSQQFFQWMSANARLLSSLDAVYSAAGTSEKVLLQAFSETAYFGAARNKLEEIHKRLHGLTAFIALLSVASTEEQAQVTLGEMLESISQSGDRNYMFVRHSGEFDDDFYLSTYQDVQSAGIDPLRHYLQYGYLEGRDPSTNFSTNFYLSNNNDVKAEGLNPLLHFIAFGRREGRTGKPSRIALPSPTHKLENNSHTLQLLNALYEIAKNLDQYDAVSFDFFDTLIERQIPDPHAVFSSMQQHEFVRNRSPSFRQLRIEAEVRARAKGKPEVTIAEIYEELILISSFQRQDICELIRLEQEYELSTLSARALGVALLEQARERRMKIVITSDFYIGEKFIREVMLKAGISSDNISILVSCDHQCTKHEGSLFDLVEAELQVPAEKILHLGDNQHSDHFMPLAKGFAAACLPPTKKAFSAHSAIDNYIQPSRDTYTSNIHSALTIDRRPLPVVATSFTEAAEFGYKILGPVILAYCQFIKQMTKLQNIDNLVFLSRDTKVVHDVYTRLYKGNDHPGSNYILVSRQAIFGASALDVNAVRDIIARDYLELSFLDLLRDRFLFDNTEIESLLAEHPWLPEVDYFDIKGPPSLTREHFFTTAMQIFEAIKNVSNLRRHAYQAYLKTTLADEAKSLLVDIGYRGTTQIALSRLFDKHMNGVYFMTWKEIDMVVRHGLGAWAFAPAGTTLQEDLTKHVSMLELVFSDPNSPTLRCFKTQDNSVTPVFGVNDLSYDQAAYLTEAHRNAVAFCEDSKNFADLMSLTEAERSEICAPLLRFFERPARHFKQIFSDAVFEDKFGGASQRLLGRRP